MNNENTSKTPFVWEGANIYFLITDRFYNGNPDNDVNFNRTKTPGKLRGFEGVFWVVPLSFHCHFWVRFKGDFLIPYPQKI